MGNLPQRPPIHRQYPPANKVQKTFILMPQNQYRPNKPKAATDQLPRSNHLPNFTITRYPNVIGQMLLQPQAPFNKTTDPAPNAPLNINFYNSDTRNTVQAVANPPAPNIQSKNQLFVPNQWIYSASPGQVIPVTQPKPQQPGATQLHQSQSNAYAIQQTGQSNQNGFRIRTVTEINKQLPQPTLNNSPILNRNASPLNNASGQHVSTELPQTHFQQPDGNENNTPPSPPYTLEDSMDVTIKRYGDQIQIFTCPKIGNRENLTDILELTGDIRKLVAGFILDEVFVNGAKNMVEVERQNGRRTDQLRNQITRFFNMTVPQQYNFLMDI